MPKRVINPKLSPEDEEALLLSLRLARDLKARALLQTESQALARKLDTVAIEKVPEEATPLVNKDKKNFGAASDTQHAAVIAVTLNAVLLSASSAVKEEAGGKGGGKAKAKAGGKAKVKAGPKIGAKVERLPPPTADAATEAIIKHKATIARISNLKDPKEGQQALLLAFESWMSDPHNEPVLPDVPKLLKALSGEDLLSNEMLSEYWVKVMSTHASDAVELKEAEEQVKEADVELAAATEQLNDGKKQDVDAAQQAKWAAAEVQNARTGNQPTGEEVAREKAANVSDTKARNNRLLRQKDVELFHKRQVTALNLQALASTGLAEKISQMRMCELMHKHGRPFFESLVVDSKSTEADKAAKVGDEKSEA